MLGRWAGRMFCCGSTSALYAPIEDFMDLIDKDCNAFTPPGLRRESRDERDVDRQLTKTSGNALHNDHSPTDSPQRVSGKIIFFFL